MLHPVANKPKWTYMGYAELHCHSYYSFHDGASSLEELLLKSKELGYGAVAITDHSNLCGAMRFAQLTHSLNTKGIIGAEVTMKGGYHEVLSIGV
jgi:error-prone DNA polymerase